MVTKSVRLCAGVVFVAILLLTALRLLTPTGSAANTITNPGYESSSSLSSPWVTEGGGTFGIDANAGKAHTGNNNAWIANSGTSWGAIKQNVTLVSNTSYTLKVWVKSSANFSGGYFGIKTTSGTVIKEIQYSGPSAFTELITTFNSGSNTSAVVHLGYTGPGVSSWIQIDDWSLDSGASPTSTPAPSGCVGSAYYVSNSGNDSNAGTSSGAAWQTLAKVHSCTFNPGTTIYFARGSSWSGGLVINNSGTSSSKITYSAYGSGTYPTFSKSGGPAFTLNASYVVISNFKVVNSGSTWGDLSGTIDLPGTDMGSLITKNGTYNIVQNSEFTGNTIGLKIWGTNNRVSYNNFYNNNVLAGNNVNINGTRVCWGALGINVNNSYNEIDHNSFTGNRGACSVPAYNGWDGGAIEVDGFSVNKLGINIHDNTSSGNQGFMEASGTEYSGWITNNTSDDYEKFLAFDIGGPFAVNPHDVSISGNRITLTLNPAGDGCWPTIGFWDGSAKANTFTFTNNYVRTKCAGVLAPYAAQTHSGNKYCRTDGNTEMWWTYGTGDTFDCTWQ